MNGGTMIRSAIDEWHSRRARGWSVGWVAVAWLAVSTLPATAQEDGAHWSARLSALAISTGGDAVTTDAGARFEVADGSGFEVDVGYHLRSGVEIELSIMFAGDLESDYRLDIGGPTLTDSQDLSTEAVWLGANYHFTSDRRADFFAGAFAGLNYFDGVTYVFPLAGHREKLSFDDDLGFGVRLGVDVAFGANRRWFASAGARYLSSILEAESGADIDLNPLILSIGVGHRF